MVKQSSLICLFISGCSYLLALPAIAQVNTISFAPTRNSIGLAVQLTPNQALPFTDIGTVTVKSTSSNGFIVQVQSNNSGMLKRTSGETIAYTFSYDGVNKGQITGLTVLEDRNSQDSICASNPGCDRNIKIAIAQTDISAKPAGAYSDQLTFTLISK